MSIDEWTSCNEAWSEDTEADSEEAMAIGLKRREKTRELDERVVDVVVAKRGIDSPERNSSDKPRRRKFRRTSTSTILKTTIIHSPLCNRQHQLAQRIIRHGYPSEEVPGPRWYVFVLLELAEWQAGVGE